MVKEKAKTASSKRGSKPPSDKTVPSAVASAPAGMQGDQALGGTIADILSEAQRSVLSHSQGISALRVQQLANRGAFAAVMFGFADHLLLVFKKEPAVERLVDFVANFATAPCKQGKERECRDDFAWSLIR